MVGHGEKEVVNYYEMDDSNPVKSGRIGTNSQSEELIGFVEKVDNDYNYYVSFDRLNW